MIHILRSDPHRQAGIEFCAAWHDLALQARALWVSGKISMGLHEGFRDMSARQRAQRASYVEHAIKETREDEVAKAVKFLDRVQVELNDAEARMRLAKNEEAVLSKEQQCDDAKTIAAARAGLIELREHKIPEFQMAIKMASQRVELAQQRHRQARGDVPSYGGRATYGSAEDRR